MPIRLIRGTSRGSGCPSAAIEQAGSPTVSAFAMRRAAAVAAGEVYHVVVTRSPPPVDGVGPGVVVFEGGAGVAVFEGGAGVAGCGVGPGVVVFEGGAGVAGRGEGLGIGKPGGSRGVADRVGGGGGVVGPAFGVRGADVPVSVRRGAGWRLGGAERVVGRCSAGADSVVLRRADGNGSSVGRCADEAGRGVGRLLGGVD